jgi:hypothetical protein
MPAKKTKKTQSQVKRKTNNKKVETKKIAPKTKKGVKKETTLSKSNNRAKKVASKKTDQSFNKKIELSKTIKPKKILWPIIILIVLLILWFLKDQLIVATINGKPITRFQVIKELEQQGASQILESLITRELVDQAVKEAGVEVDEEAVAAQMAEIEESLTAQGQNLDDILAMQNLTRADVEKDISLNLQVDQILADEIQVSEEEVLEYFETNKEFLGEDLDFEEMREQIEAQVIQEKRTEAQQEWLETIREEANIRYFKFEPTSLF